LLIEIKSPLAFVARNLNRFRKYTNNVFGLLDMWRVFGDSLENSQLQNQVNELKALENKIDK